MTTPEDRARELLAAEYEADGWAQKAGFVRGPEFTPSPDEQRALRAITRALQSPEPARYRSTSTPEGERP